MGSISDTQLKGCKICVREGWEAIVVIRREELSHDFVSFDVHLTLLQVE